MLIEYGKGGLPDSSVLFSLRGEVKQSSEIKQRSWECEEANRRVRSRWLCVCNNIWQWRKDWKLVVDTVGLKGGVWCWKPGTVDCFSESSDAAKIRFNCAASDRQKSYDTKPAMLKEWKRRLKRERREWKAVSGQRAGSRAVNEGFVRKADKLRSARV